MTLIFDSHLDLAWNALSWNRDLTAPLDEIRRCEAGLEDRPARGHATVSLSEMRRGRIAICLATVLVRAGSEVNSTLRVELDARSPEIAYAIGQGQLTYYRMLQRQGHCRLLRTRAELEQHWQRWQKPEHRATETLGCIVSMEGADPIMTPGQAEEWYADGLRVVGLAHYGQGRYAYGTGGEGSLTILGRELLREFDRIGMILDLTHASDPSFYEALDVFDGPVLASHNNCRALVPGDRQYSDEQIRVIVERGGVIGVALDNWMLRASYIRGESDRATVPLSLVADHIDHICQLAGNCRHAAIGSDLDGGFGTEQCPVELDSIADLQKLDGILQERGYSDEDMAAVLHGNWLRYFVEHLPE